MGTNYENNPYYQVHIRGKQREEARRHAASTTATVPRWYDDVTRFLDDEDLVQNPLSMAHAAFSSVPPSTNPKISAAQMSGSPSGADVPREVFVKLFMEAWRGRGMAIMTARQRLAWEAYEEANSLGVPHGEHIANRLDVSRSAAYWYLNQIRTKLTQRFAPERDTMIEIRSIKRALPRKCAMCGTTTPAPDKPLCGPCHTRFNLNHKYGAYSPSEIERYIRIADREHSRQARLIYETRTGRVF